MNPPDLRLWKTPPGALNDYEQHWLPTTDAPREYLIACALATIATVLANRVWLPFGGDRLMANLWIVLLGPSSNYRKTTCVKQCRRTLARISAGQSQKYVFPDEWSREAFVSRLGDQGQGLLTFSEFSGALATFNRDYMSGTRELLADLYDSPDTYERVIGNKTVTARNVSLGILAASQTDWLLEKLKESDIRGGFLARFAFWPAFYKRRFLAIPPEPDAQVGNELARRLNRIQQLEGPMVMPESVRARYSAWLEQHEKELDTLPRAGQLGPFWSRMSQITLKFAMVITVATTGQLVMTDEAIESAIELSAFMKAALGHLFAEEIAFTPDMRNRQKVLKTIQRHPGIPFRTVSMNAGLLKRQLEAVIETLRAENAIEVRDGGYWPVDELGTVGNESANTKRAQFTRVK